MSFKVAVKVMGESGPNYNGIRLATREEATNYARDLYSRWTLMTGFDIEESDEPVNYMFKSGEGLKAVDNVVS